MASNQTNRFQSLDSSAEEFIDGQENENTKKKTKFDVALFHEFLVLKLKARRFKHAGSDKQHKKRSRVFTSVFQVLNFRRTTSTYFQYVLFYRLTISAF